MARQQRFEYGCTICSFDQVSREDMLMNRIFACIFAATLCLLATSPALAEIGVTDEPVKCRKNIQDARQELREGKRDKKDRD